jgi:hypothetical protein
MLTDLWCAVFAAFVAVDLIEKQDTAVYSMFE